MKTTWTVRLGFRGFVLWLWATIALGAAEPATSRLVEWSGAVEVSMTNAAFVPASTNQVLRVGDRLRTGPASRATLQLSDRSVVRVGASTVLEIRDPVEATGTRRFQLRSGLLFFLNRERPSSVEFDTPLVSGAIRGTEFQLRVDPADGATVLGLFAGAVELKGASGAVAVEAGQEVEIRPGQAAQVRPVLPLRRGIQWAFHYPIVLDATAPELGLAGNVAWQPVVVAYAAGDLRSAYAQLPSAVGGGEPAGARLLRAALELSMGRVTESGALLEGVEDPGLRGSVEALRELIAAVALDVPAGSLVEPTEASGWLARSYLLQSRLDLPGAWTAADRAVALSPGFGAAWVRRAELALSMDRRTEARRSLEQARGLASKHAGARVVEGFLAMEERRWKEAGEAFSAAIAMDGSLSTAWLGRGLLGLHLGQEVEALSDLQVAAVLEPQRGAYRAALGKAFSAKGEVPLADKEFRLARELDPADPTPWFYAGLHDLQQNRYNAAVRNLEEASARNDGSAVFRSRQQLDRDQAMRSADLGVAYAVTGLDEVAWRAATRAVVEDYTDFSGHLFTARALQLREDPAGFDLRWETARQAELLVANLLAPPGAGNLSRVLSQQDHLRAFGLAPIGAASRTEYRSRGDWEQTGSVFGQVAAVGYAIDTEYRSLRGQGPLQGQESYRSSLQVRFDLGPSDAILIQTAVGEGNAEDVARRYDPNGATALRAWSRREPELQVGYRHEWRPGVVTLGLVSHLSDRLRVENPDAQTPFLVQRGGVPAGFGTVASHGLEFESEFEVNSVELQQVVQGEWQGIIAGARYQAGDVDARSRLVPVLPGPVIESVNRSDLERVNGYAYWQVRPWNWLRAWAGVSYDHLEYPANADLAPLGSDGSDRSDGSVRSDRSLLAPKLALAVTPWKGGELRATFTRSMGGLYFDDSMRLEPGQVAGFGQSFRSLAPESVIGLVPATAFETIGVRWDQKLPRDVYVGVEALRMESDGSRGVGVLTNSLPFPVADSPSQIGQDVAFTERSVAGYAGMLVGEAWSLGVRPRVSEAELRTRFPSLPEGLPGLEAMSGARTATLLEVGLWLRMNHPSGFFAGWDSTWRQQWLSGAGAPGTGDVFWQHDVHVGYRWPRRHAEVRLGVLNLTDTDYRLDPLNLMAEPARQRVVQASLRVNF